MCSSCEKKNIYIYIVLSTTRLFEVCLSQSISRGHQHSTDNCQPSCWKTNNQSSFRRKEFAKVGKTLCTALLLRNTRSSDLQLSKSYRVMLWLLAILKYSVARQKEIWIHLNTNEKKMQTHADSNCRYSRWVQLCCSFFDYLQ